MFKKVIKYLRSQVWNYYCPKCKTNFTQAGWGRCPICHNRFTTEIDQKK